MNPSEAILIFTDKSIDSINPVLPKNGDSGTKFKLISDPDDFRSYIENGHIAYIIIDSDCDLFLSGMRELVGLAKQRNIPVVIGNPRNDSVHKLKKLQGETDERLSAGKSIMLRHKWPETIPVERDEIQLVTETAATLCHEINNPLMTITASTEILLNGKYKLPDDIRKKVRSIDRAAGRIKATIEKLTYLDSLNYKNTIAGRMIKLRKSIGHCTSSLSKISE